MTFKETVYVLVLIDRKPPYSQNPREFLLETEGQGREGVSQVATFSILFLNKEDWSVLGFLTSDGNPTSQTYSCAQPRTFS